MNWIACIALFFGLILGSFLNVVIYRLPQILFPELASEGEKLTLAFPASHCTHCKKRLRWHHNIPLLSFIFLKGRCADCHQKISFTYPLVEVLTAILFSLVVMTYPHWPQAIAAMVFISISIPLFFIDLRYQLLPDILNYGLLWAGLGFNAFSVFTSSTSAVLGALIGYGIFWMIAQGYLVIRKKEGLGLGDCKLLAAIGAWLGWQALPEVILVASVLGLVVMGMLALFKKADLRQTFPFGPALIIAGLGFLI